MQPPRTIPDSDADSETPETSASPEPPAAAIALGASRKRSASPDPTYADQEVASRPLPGAVNALQGRAGDAAKVGEETTTAPELVSQEAREEEKRVMQIEAIKARNNELAAEVEAMETKLADARGKLKNPDAAATVKAHIKRLHAYNEIRDVGQGLIGLIAEQRGVRIGECYDSGEFGVGAKD
ncbi:hypothetical protein VE02_07107 [Pseudogymnoascus sp. 03VT05]|nr:hypothetical protein VE02_07107 [Pseudogymnoascus sp. 03VT05]